MTDDVVDFTDDLRVPRIDSTSNGYPIDAENYTADGVVYKRQRVANVQEDSTGREVIQLTSAFGEQIVVQLHPQWQQSFEYTVNNTALNTNTVTGSGGVSQVTAMAKVFSGVTIGSNAMLQSDHHAKYRAGCGMMLRFSAMFSTPVAGTFQYIGMMDEHGAVAEFKNGFAIGYNGTALTIARFANDTLFEVPRASWDDKLDGTGTSGANIDFTKLNVFYIQAQYLGSGAIHFWCENPDTGVPFVFHRIKYANRYVVPSTYNPNYHFTMYVDNVATTSDVAVYCASYGYFVEGLTGLIEVHQPQFSSGTKSKTTVTTEVAIFTIKNKTTYPTAAPKTNYIDLILERVGCSIEASSTNNLGTVRIVKNATLGGTPSFADISATDSIAQIDVAGTTVTGGQEYTSFELAGKNDKENENVLPFKIIVHPGETITIAGLSANSATIKASLLWKELM